MPVIVKGVGLDTVKSLYNPDNKLFIKYDRFMLQLLKQVSE